MADPFSTWPLFKFGMRVDILGDEDAVVGRGIMMDDEFNPDSLCSDLEESEREVVVPEESRVTGWWKRVSHCLTHLTRANDMHDITFYPFDSQVRITTVTKAGKGVVFRYYCCFDSDGNPIIDATERKISEIIQYARGDNEVVLWYQHVRALKNAMGGPRKKKPKKG